VPGRLERVAPGVFVDYAHTPDALAQALTALRECGYGRIICLFGCGGERDKGKRPMMGAVAARLADFSVITSDNPRSEDPRAIIAEIKKGFFSRACIALPGREAAIKRALAIMARHRNSCLLAAGKGHEDYQVVKGVRVPFSDRKIIKKYYKYYARR